MPRSRPAAPGSRAVVLALFTLVTAGVAGVPAPRVALAQRRTIVVGPCVRPGATVSANVSTGQGTAPGAVDPYWELVGAPSPSTASPSAPLPAYAVVPSSAWCPAGAARWISSEAHAGTGALKQAPGGHYSYRLTFTLPAGCTAPTIAGRLAGDNHAGLYLNGALIRTSFAYPQGHFPCAAITYSNPAAFVVGGLNELVVRVRNADSVTGLLLDATVSATCPGGGTCFRLSPPAANGLVGWWKLDDAANASSFADLRGASNAAQPLPTAAGWGPVPGVVGSARQFGGRYAAVADHPELDFGAGPFSIDAWVRPVAVNGSGFSHPIVDKTPGPGQPGFVFGLAGGTPMLVRNGTTYVPSGAVSLAFNAWSFVAVTVQPHANPALGKVVFFVNGSAYPSASPVPATPVSTPGVPLWIARSRVPNRGMELAIDELELFRTAVPPADMLGIYQAGAAGKCP